MGTLFLLFCALLFFYILFVLITFRTDAPNRKVTLLPFVLFAVALVLFPRRTAVDNAIITVLEIILAVLLPVLFMRWRWQLRTRKLEALVRKVEETARSPGGDSQKAASQE